MRPYTIRYSLLPTEFRPLKTMRRVRFHPVAHGYLFGQPSKKIRLMLARKRRHNPFHTKQAARHHNTERWGSRFGWKLGYSIQRVQAVQKLQQHSKAVECLTSPV